MVMYNDNGYDQDGNFMPPLPVTPESIIYDDNGYVKIPRYSPVNNDKTGNVFS